MPSFVAHVVRADRTRFGTLFTVAFHVEGRFVGEVIVAVLRHRGVSTEARLFDVDVRGGLVVVLGRA